MKRVFLFVLLLSAAALFAADIPYLTGRVTDNAQLLSPAVKQALSDSLKAHEDKTSNQVAVLTIPVLGDESIEEFAVKVFEAWELGQKGKDNGILIVVAPNDRRMRIEVGYGLEHILTDLQAGQIIRDIMTPRFKEGDFNGGITEGTLAVIDILRGGELPESSSGKDGGLFDGIEDTGLSVTERILMGAFVFGIIGLFTFIGIVTPGIGWFLYFFLIPFWASFPIFILGSNLAFKLLIVYVIGYPIAKLLLRKTEWYKKARKELKTKGKTTIGGFTMRSGSSGSSWSSGSSSSSSSGGSSFSGGGGSSGGGGASGSW